MKGVMFNIDNGYLEGLCRGFKNGEWRKKTKNIFMENFMELFAYTYLNPQPQEY